jgi:hypothetical protein
MKQESKEAKLKEKKDWKKNVKLTKQPHEDTETRHKSQHSGYKEYNSISFVWWSISEMLATSLQNTNIQG